MKVLIVEDNQSKAAALTAAVQAGGVPLDNVVVVPDAMNARERLQAGGIDLLLLDLQIPTRYGESAARGGGGEMIRWLFRRPERQPPHILAVTAYEVDEETRLSLASHGIAVLVAQPSKEDWRVFIRGYAERLMRSASNRETDSRSQVVDCVVVTAVDLEHDHAQRVFGVTAPPVLDNGVNWSRSSISTETGDRSVVLAQSVQMGMPAAAVLASKSISLWRPKLVIMSGICAAIRGQATYGDLVVPDPCWDYGSGKLADEGILKPDPRPIELREAIRSSVLAAKARAPLSQWREAWIADKPNSVPQVYVLPSASGAAVLADGSTASQVKDRARKAVGIDMENYGFYFACANSGLAAPPAFFAVKAVVDFADSDKDDRFQAYGAHLAARFARWVVENYQFWD